MMMSLDACKKRVNTFIPKNMCMKRFTPPTLFFEQMRFRHSKSDSTANFAMFQPETRIQAIGFRLFISSDIAQPEGMFMNTAHLLL